ncbi:MAG TPA: cyclic nucleotide-binding domain-containing protein [bacterium]|nr:cyclic nucleotide-binding domain-containing protein [bacterium]
MSPSDSLRLVGPMERALFLKSLGPMGDLSPSDIAVFAEHARERHFRAGDVITRAGEPVDCYHMIVEGQVQARGAEYVDGMERGPRDPLGFLSMLARREDLEAVAAEPTVTLELEDDVLYDILEDSFEIAVSLIRRLAGMTLEVRKQIPSGAYLAPLDGVLTPPGRPLDLVERILLVRRPGSPFAGASLDAVTTLARNTPEVNYRQGQTIWKSGDRSDHALILIAGSVSCTTQWGFSRFRAGPGYPLGNLERFSGDPRWYSAVAETDVVALRTDTEAFLDLLEDHFDMAMSFIRSMAERVIGIREETAAAERGTGEAAA